MTPPPLTRSTATMAQTLSELLKQSTIDDHDEVIKACNAALKKSKSDSHARHVKTVALLKLDRFDDAIRVIDEGGDAFKQVAVLEWAYALYKTGHPQETVRIAGGLGANRGARHLEAQAVSLQAAPLFLSLYPG